MTTVTLEGTQELMKQREVAVILATGGMGLVRAAYSAGKPAYGVGPGNAPVLHRVVPPTCRRRRRDILIGKSLRQRRALLVAELGRRGRGGRGGSASGSSRRRARYFLSPPRADALAKVLVSPQRLPQPGARRQAGDAHRREGGHHRAAGHARADRAARPASGATSRSRSRSCAPSSPIYVVKDWREGCERCKQILRYGGMGHTMSIHSRNDAGDPRVRPAQAGVPHLREHADHARLDRPHDGTRSGDDARLRRVRRQHHVRQHLAAAPAEHQAAGLRAPAAYANRRPPRGRDARRPDSAAGAAAAARRCAPPPTAISGDALSRRIDQFLQSRGFARGAPGPAVRRRSTAATRRVSSHRPRRVPCGFRLRRRRAAGDQAGTRIALGRTERSSPRQPAISASRTNLLDLPGVTTAAVATVIADGTTYRLTTV